MAFMIVYIREVAEDKVIVTSTSKPLPSRSKGCNLIRFTKIEEGNIHLVGFTKDYEVMPEEFFVITHAKQINETDGYLIIDYKLNFKYDQRLYDALKKEEIVPEVKSEQEIMIDDIVNTALKKASSIVNKIKNTSEVVNDHSIINVKNDKQDIILSEVVLKNEMKTGLSIEIQSEVVNDIELTTDATSENMLNIQSGIVNTIDNTIGECIPKDTMTEELRTHNGKALSEVVSETNFTTDSDMKTISTIESNMTDTLKNVSSVLSKVESSTDVTSKNVLNIQSEVESDSRTKSEIVSSTQSEVVNEIENVPITTNAIEDNLLKVVFKIQVAVENMLNTVSKILFTIENIVNRTIEIITSQSEAPSEIQSKVKNTKDNTIFERKDTSQKFVKKNDSYKFHSKRNKKLDETRHKYTHDFSTQDLRIFFATCLQLHKNDHSFYLQHF